jgi:hypothetical protein
MANISKRRARVKSGTVVVRHATPSKNLPSIFRHGLLTSKSQGKQKAIWLHTAALSGWAVVHTARRHHVAIEGVAILEVRIPRAALRRSRPGLSYCLRDIGPERIGAARGVDQFAARAVRVG